MTNVRVARTALLVLIACAACHPEPSTRGAQRAPNVSGAEPVIFEDSLPPAGLVYGEGVVALSAWARSQHKPWFDDYPATPEAVVNHAFDLSSPPARRWRTLLHQAVLGGPDFAGRYRLQPLAGGGLGTGAVAVLDFGTGQVHFTTFDCCWNPLWRADSRLLIDDPTILVHPSGGHPDVPWIRYYLWTGTAFRALDSLDVSRVRVVLR